MSRLLPSGLFLLALTLSLTAVLAFRLLPSRYSLRVGEVVPQTIKSPKRVTFTSQLKTEEKRAQAAAAIADIFVFHPEIESAQRRALEKQLAQVDRLRQDAGLTPAEKSTRLAQVGGPSLSLSLAEDLFRMDEAAWQRVKETAPRWLSQVLQGPITPDQLTTVQERLGERVPAELLPLERQLLVGLISPLLAPSLLVDQERTEAARQEALQAVKPVLVALEQGETIVRDGDILQRLDLEKLEAAELTSPQVHWEGVAAIALLALLVGLGLLAYLWLFQPRLLASPRRLALLLVVTVGAVLAAKLTIPERELFSHLFPLATAPMIVATLLDVQLALLVVALLSLVVGYVGGGSLELITYYFGGGLTGLLLVWQARRLSRFFLAGVAVAGASFLVVLAFWWLRPEAELERLATLSLISLANGGLSAVLTVGTVAALSYLFGITTNLTLMELAQPNHPLLRRLLLEAPGTYHHSILVGNLAERAAEAVGADSLLVRVGSYYHDIGKVARPGYFVENQLGENPHNGLAPQTSAAVVAGHITEGLALARAHRLPHRLWDFIGEHHGTRWVSFFYQKAKEQGQEVDEAVFRYSGPPPHSRETAIVMLADSVEATLHSLERPTPEKIDELVDKVVAERLAEGQLNHSDLTLRDLERIKETFKETLRGAYHPRLEYPEPLIPDEVKP